MICSLFLSIFTLVLTVMALPQDQAPGTSDGGTAGQSDVDRYLESHNSVRAQHDAIPLVWNDTAADLAQRWADRCVFEHSGGQLGPLGENLAAGYGNGWDIEKAIKAWADEVSQYDPNNPQPSHYTQIVWKSTTSVGCAVNTCNNIFPGNDALYYVCEYFPQGNILSNEYFGANVQR